MSACAEVLASAEYLVISAGTVAEALIVAQRRNIGEEMRRLIDGLGFEVTSVTAAQAAMIAEAYDRWGKGQHSAGLNYGDCFSYALASDTGEPLLFKGDDFAATDVVPAC